MKQIVFVILDRGKGNTSGAEEVMIISDNTKEGGGGGGITPEQLEERLEGILYPNGIDTGFVEVGELIFYDRLRNEDSSFLVAGNGNVTAGGFENTDGSFIVDGSGNVIANNLYTKSEVDSLLSGKMSIFYKSSAPFAPFSGASVETIIAVIPINPNKLRNNTMAVGKAMIRKNNVVSALVTLTMYLNTAPNLTGATPLRSSHATSGTMQSSSFETEFWIEDNLMRVPNTTTISNVGTTANSVSEIPFNPANQYYIIVTGNPSNTSAEIQCKIAQLTGTY